MHVLLMPLPHGALGSLDELLACVFFLALVLVIFFFRALRNAPDSAASAPGRTLPLRKRGVLLGGVGGAALLGLLALWQSQILQAQSTISPASPLYVPDADRLATNPLPVDASALANGKLIYQQNCAVCHGAEGRGNGPLAASLDPRPVDLTVHALQHTEGELFYWVTHGIAGSAMADWKAQLSDEQRWQVVQFIRAFP